MKNMRYIRFNKKDEILSVHKSYVSSLSKTTSNYNETYIDLEDYDLSKLCNLDQIKKGTVIKGIWNFISNINEDKYLTKIMADYLNKVYVQSEAPRYELSKKGLKSHSALLDDLKVFNIGFDDWVKKYTEAGKELKVELELIQLEKNEAETLAKAELKKATEHFQGACFSLPAIAGKMGSNIYYTVQIPFAQVPQLFNFNQEEIPVELRAQRQLNPKRASSISDYMEDRQEDYILPALTASVSETMRFEPVEGFSNLGMVQIPINATILPNDGQHRISAIDEILKRLNHFKDQSISVVLFYDQGLQRAQQMFADINDKMVKPPKALNILFDRTNIMNSLVIDSIEAAGIKQAVEFEKANPGAKSSKVWSVSALKKAAEILTGLNDKKAKNLHSSDYDHYKALLVNWFTTFIENTSGGLKNDVANGTHQSLTETRINKVSTHAVFLHAVAMASKSLCHEFYNYMADGLNPEFKDACPVPTFYDLKCLQQLSVTKSADIWRERIVNTDGTMNPTANGIKLGAYVILERLGQFIPAPIAEINNTVFNESA